jgi:hypothetical protein
MQTTELALSIGNAAGVVKQVPARMHASHQAGHKLFLGELADPATELHSGTEPSFAAFTMFDMLCAYRQSIEPDGWRLLHAAARADAWPNPKLGVYTVDVQILVRGLAETIGIKMLDPAPFEAVTTLDRQRANFEAWMASLPAVYEGRVPPRAGHDHDPPRVDFGPLSRFAGRILSQKDED